VENISTVPGGISVVSDTQPGSALKPTYQIQPDIDAMENSVDKVQQRINSSFFADLFMMIANIDKSGVTAEEIAKKYEEKLLLLGPVIEGLESELLNPLIDRVFFVMMRLRLLPPPPEELSGQELKVEYISMLAQAQKSAGIAYIERFAAFINNVAEQHPGIKDNFDVDKAAEEMSEMLGASKILRSREEVAKIRAAREKLEQLQQKAAAAQMMVTGAKTLADTPLGNGSALDKTLEQVGGNGKR
jgi:hypothetical protein